MYSQWILNPSVPHNETALHTGGRSQRASEIDAEGGGHATEQQPMVQCCGVGT